ncbi:MAG: hypothetical protein ABH845_01855, partial [Candidatus Omnitrophota bacterium]
MTKSLKALGLFLVFLFVLHLPAHAQERITLTTYYPAPYGDYEQLRLVPSAAVAVGDVCIPATQEGVVRYDSINATFITCDPTTSNWEEFGGAALWEEGSDGLGGFIYPEDTTWRVVMGDTAPLSGTYRLTLRSWDLLSQLWIGGDNLNSAYWVNGDNTYGLNADVSVHAGSVGGYARGQSYGLWGVGDTAGVTGESIAGGYPIRGCSPSCAAPNLNNTAGVFSGRVGVGTASPAVPLHVYSSANPTALRIHSSGAPGFGALEFWSDPETSANLWRPGYIQSYDAGSFTGGLRFITNGTGAGNKTGTVEAMRIINTRVGINQTSPGAALDVNTSSSTWGGWQEAIRFSNPNHSAITHVNPVGNLLLGFHSSAGGSPRGFWFTDAGAAANGADYIMVVHAGAVGSGLGDGKVGIGANWYPNERLYVNGDVAITGKINLGGVVDFTQPHPTDPAKEISYITFEGREPRILFDGTAFLKDGKAAIQVPEDFRLVSSEENLNVILTPFGETEGLYVAKRSLDEIIVKEGKGGQSNVSFGYLVVGYRKGFEVARPVQENKSFRPKED